MNTREILLTTFVHKNVADLKSTTFKVGAYLCGLAGGDEEVCSSNSHTARGTRLSEHTVQQAIHELQTKGILEIVSKNKEPTRVRLLIGATREEDQPPENLQVEQHQPPPISNAEPTPVRLLIAATKEKDQPPENPQEEQHQPLPVSNAEPHQIDRQLTDLYEGITDYIPNTEELKDLKWLANVTERLLLECLQKMFDSGMRYTPQLFPVGVKDCLLHPKMFAIVQPRPYVFFKTPSANCLR
jgi:hypothetical protein